MACLLGEAEGAGSTASGARKALYQQCLDKSVLHPIRCETRAGGRGDLRVLRLSIAERLAGGGLAGMAPAFRELGGPLVVAVAPCVVPAPIAGALSDALLAGWLLPGRLRTQRDLWFR